jgi:hypothetical protein
MSRFQRYYQKNKEKLRLRYRENTKGKTLRNRNRRELRKKNMLREFLSGISVELLCKKYKISATRCCRILINESPVTYKKKVRELAEAKKKERRNKIKNRKKKRCNNCKKNKQKKYFQKDSSSITGLRVFCKECVNEKRADYRKRNKKKIQAYQKKYVRRNKKIKSS